MPHLPRDIGEQIAFRPTRGQGLIDLVRRLVRWVSRAAQGR